MELELEFNDWYCSPYIFKINNINADLYDFGDKNDISPELLDEDEFGCGNMEFSKRKFTPEILKKYEITEKEYEIIAKKLEEGLSFGYCCFCS